jgi:hypothetical protein
LVLIPLVVFEGFLLGGGGLRFDVKGTARRVAQVILVFFSGLIFVDCGAVLCSECWDEWRLRKEFIEKDSSYGVFSLRRPASRATILVIRNVIDLWALEMEAEDGCVGVHPSRFDRIETIIRDDTELTVHSKETALEFLLCLLSSSPAGVVTTPR